MLFIFCIPLLGLLFLIFSDYQSSHFLALYFSLILFFVGAHTWLPTLVVILFKSEREKIVQLNKNVFFISGFFFLVPVFLLTSTVFDNLGLGSYSQTIFFSIGAVYFFWNIMHFTMQQAGILLLYKKKEPDFQLSDYKLDVIVSHILLTIFPIISWTNSSLRTGLFVAYLGPDTLKTLNSLHNSHFIYFCYVVILLHIIRISVNRKYNLMIVLQYLSIFIQSIGVYLYPSFFTFIIYRGVHWAQEVYLVQSYVKLQKEKLTFALLFLLLNTFAIWLYIGSNFSARIVSLFFNEIPLIGLKKIDYYIFSVINGLIIGSFFVHYYLDPYIHRKRHSFNDSP